MAVNAAIIRREDANNCVELAVQLDRPCKRVRVGMQAFAPETVARHCEFAPLVRLRIEPPGVGTDTQHVEEVRAGRKGPQHFAASARTPDPIAQSTMKG